METNEMRENQTEIQGIQDTLPPSTNPVYNLAIYAACLLMLYVAVRGGWAIVKDLFEPWKGVQ